MKPTGIEPVTETAPISIPLDPEQQAHMDSIRQEIREACEIENTRRQSENAVVRLEIKQTSEGV